MITMTTISPTGHTLRTELTVYTLDLALLDTDPFLRSARRELVELIELGEVTAQINTAASVFVACHAARSGLARGSSEHRIADYAARYHAERAELTQALADSVACVSAGSLSVR